MKKLILILVTLSALFLGVMLLRHPIILKTATGSARVLSSPLNATIKIDGIVQPSARCFMMETYFDGNRADRIVLWLQDTPVPFKVLIVDKLDQEVGYPRLDRMRYDLLWNRYLFQADNAVAITSFRSEKSFAQNPRLEIRDNYIRFVVPRLSDVEEHVIEIVFDSAPAA